MREICTSGLTRGWGCGPTLLYWFNYLIAAGGWSVHSVVATILQSIPGTRPPNKNAPKDRSSGAVHVVCVRLRLPDLDRVSG